MQDQLNLNRLDFLDSRLSGANARTSSVKTIQFWTCNSVKNHYIGCKGCALTDLHMAKPVHMSVKLTWACPVFVHRFEEMELYFDKREIGKRLAIAREIAGKQREESANVIDISKQELSLVESGFSALSVDKIETLADFYDFSSSRILCPDAVRTSLALRFRSFNNMENGQYSEVTKQLYVLFTAEAELEKVLGIEHSTNYPKRHDYRKKGVKDSDKLKDLAVAHAKRLREFLGLGDGPIEDIFSIIVKKLGIRLYQRNLGENSRVWGIYGFGESYGDCILINANYTRPWRVETAAHELGHFISDRNNSVLDEEHSGINVTEECYARKFGDAFTMPESSFRKSYFELFNDSKKLTQELVLKLADKFHVTSNTCIQQLEEYGLVQDAKVWYESTRKISIDEKKRILGIERYNRRYAHCSDADRIVPYHIGLMAHKAWKQVLLSEEQLSNILDLGRIEVQKILNEFEMGNQI